MFLSELRFFFVNAGPGTALGGVSRIRQGLPAQSCPAIPLRSLADDREIDDHDQAQDDPVPSENLEVM